jgi:hypothetical protein
MRQEISIRYFNGKVKPWGLLMQTRRDKAGESQTAGGQPADHGSGRTMGRPSLPREVVRSHRIVTFLTEQEKASVVRLANESSQSLSAVCHRLIVQGLNPKGSG